MGTREGAYRVRARAVQGTGFATAMHERAPLPTLYPALERKNQLDEKE